MNPQHRHRGRTGESARARTGRRTTGGSNLLLQDVAMMEHRVTLVGALGGLLAHAGRRLEPAYLMGVTGHAFRLTLDLVISPSAPHELNFHEVFPLWERLGAWFKRVAARPGDPG